jgi:hypothetical protein
MKAIAMIAQLLLAACGSRDTVVDPRLQPHVDSFMSDCKSHGMQDKCNVGMAKLSSVEFGSEAPTFAGVCIRDGLNRVVIDESISDDQIKFVVYHELGHCILGKQHDNSEIMASDYEGNGVISDAGLNQLFQ